jgi:hypothetical protein
MITATLCPSEFKNLQGIEYFDFEEDFMEDNIRCIPMTVRFKMDAIGIKLKLSEWSKFEPYERVQLALLDINNKTERNRYRMYLTALISRHTANQPTALEIDPQPDWANVVEIPGMLFEKSAEIQLAITINQWRNLSPLQRFALLKLCRPGHENKNFPKAAKEFGLLTD